MGAPTDPIVRTLPADAAGADAAVADGVRDALLTGADVAQASAGASAAIAARERTVNCVIGDSELGFVKSPER